MLKEEKVAHSSLHSAPCFHALRLTMKTEQIISQLSYATFNDYGECLTHFDDNKRITNAESGPNQYGIVVKELMDVFSRKK